MNKNNHSKFDAGNWKGKRLEDELRFFDQAYNRHYDPDAVKYVKS